MESSFTLAGVAALLGLGLVFGLKHATEVDHVVAVSTIVSGHRSVWRSSLIGGLWGAGHTASLVAVGVLVLGFRVAIPAAVASWLELGVAIMIIGLGAMAIARLFRTRADVHLHRHQHDGTSHLHLHFHEHQNKHLPGVPENPSPATHSHAVSELGFKPFLVGAMHGLAGSAALTLLVLTQIDSVWVGLLYLALFGIGSTVGMLVMSGLIAIPFAFSGQRFSNVNYGLQAIAGSISIVFGLWYAYQGWIQLG